MSASWRNGCNARLARGAEHAIVIGDDSGQIRSQFLCRDQVERVERPQRRGSDVSRSLEQRCIDSNDRDPIQEVLDNVEDRRVTDASADADCFCPQDVT